jgi:hypothetical protein
MPRKQGAGPGGWNDKTVTKEELQVCAWFDEHCELAVVVIFNAAQTLNIIISSHELEMQTPATAAAAVIEPTVRVVEAVEASPAVATATQAPYVPSPAPVAAAPKAAALAASKPVTGKAWNSLFK